MIQVSKQMAGLTVLTHVFFTERGTRRETRIEVNSSGAINLSATGDMNVAQTEEFIKAMRLAADIATTTIEIEG